ncbi:SMI1/KNR4 family protein [Micromonospora sp. NPDC023633]|uniref:SMI1/KNR4 family protein n=1 Tax=Micromonospora sp. NPDC023633 TaxID=3154320 RepID=UPI0033E0BC59
MPFRGRRRLRAGRRRPLAPLGATLPKQYKAFMMRYGSGQFGSLDLLPIATAASAHHFDDVLSVSQAEFPDGSFVAVAPVGTGDYWCFRPRRPVQRRGVVPLPRRRRPDAGGTRLSGFRSTARYSALTQTGTTVDATTLPLGRSGALPRPSLRDRNGSPRSGTPQGAAREPRPGQGQAATRSPTASLDPTENPGQEHACPTEETLPTAQPA